MAFWRGLAPVPVIRAARSRRLSGGKRDTGHQHDEQIDRAVDAAEQHIGQGQDQLGNQN
jgi:hypothetical protein